MKLAELWENSRLGRFVSGKNPSVESKPQALRAAELNRLLSTLRTTQGIHSKEEFHRQIQPIYRAMLAELAQDLGQETAERIVIDLMERTKKACRRAGHSLLPKGRPGTDYRKYEIEYADALVTVMAVDCLLTAKQGIGGTPEQVAERLVPQALLSRLQGDSMVWEDWMGFFEQSSLGGLFEASGGSQLTELDGEGGPDQEPNPVDKTGALQATQRSRVKASGWLVVDAIKACLADGTLAHNQLGALVQVDKDGRTFLQSPGVFEEVRSLRGLEESARNMENRFARLKLSREKSGGWKYFKGKSLKSEPLVKGYVVDDATIFWSGEAPVGRFVVKDLTI